MTETVPVSGEPGIGGGRASAPVLSTRRLVTVEVWV